MCCPEVIGIADFTHMITYFHLLLRVLMFEELACADHARGRCCYAGYYRC